MQSNVQFNGTLNAGYDLTYTYNNDEGKKFQLASVRDINYRTEEIPTDSTNIKKKDIGENVISSTVTGAVAGNLKIKGSYNNSKVTISKLTKKMTANPITGRKAGVLTKRERKALKSAISDYKSNLGLEIGSNAGVSFASNRVQNRNNNGKKKN